MAESKRIKEAKSNSRSRKSSLSAVDELSVAQIMLDLHKSVDMMESVPAPKWIRKRRRSDCATPASSAPPLQIITDCEIEEIKVKSKSNDAAAATASPVTPLAFSPSESEEKCERSSKKSSRKRSTGDYVDVIGELTQSRDLLRKEVENVKKYYNQLKSLNSHLKAKKDEVLRRKGLVALDFMGVSFGPLSGPMEAQFGIPDLNKSAVENGADRKARFAEARRIRKGIIKIKCLRNGGCSSNLGPSR